MALPSGDSFDRSQITRIDEAMFPSASIHDSAIDERALGRPGGSPKRSAGQPRQGLIWSLLAMGLAACGGGGGGGAVTSGGTTEPAGDGTTEPAAPPPPSGFLAVDESSTGGSQGRTVLVVNFDRLIDQDGIPADRSNFTYMWKYRDGTKIEGDGIERKSNGIGLTLPSAIVASRRDEIVVEVTYTDNKGNEHIVTGRLDKHHGNDTTATRDEFIGTENVRDLFTVGDRTATREEAEMITGFNGQEGDKLRFIFDPTELRDEDAALLNLYTKFEALDDDNLANDLVIYANPGHVNGTVRAILKDVDADFRLTNDHVWENATITHTHTHDGSDAGSNQMTGVNGERDIFIVDTTRSNVDGIDVIRNFERGTDKVSIKVKEGDDITGTRLRYDMQDGNIFVFTNTVSDSGYSAWQNRRETEHLLFVIENIVEFDVSDVVDFPDLVLSEFVP
jgi:hypothetical protein